MVLFHVRQSDGLGCSAWPKKRRVACLPTWAQELDRSQFPQGHERHMLDCLCKVVAVQHSAWHAWQVPCTAEAPLVKPRGVSTLCRLQGIHKEA